MVFFDEASAQKLAGFSKAEFENLTRFLTMAFGMFLQDPGSASYKDTIIIKFTPRQVEKLAREGKRIDRTVYEAALTLSHQGFLLPRIEDLPATREAIAKGWFADQEDAFRTYILRGEGDTAKRLLTGD